MFGFMAQPLSIDRIAAQPNRSCPRGMSQGSIMECFPRIRMEHQISKRFCFGWSPRVSPPTGLPISRRHRLFSSKAICRNVLLNLHGIHSSFARISRIRRGKLHSRPCSIHILLERHKIGGIRVDAGVAGWLDR